MSFAITNLDVHFLVKEIREQIVNAFVDKIYQDKEDFLIRMRSPTAGKKQLYIKVPHALFLTEHKFVWPKIPKGFCMQLRKHLNNSKVTSFEQINFERIVRIEFKKGDKVWQLYIELFSKGNVILVNSENIIRGVMDLQRWKDRTLRVNAEFTLPPEVLNTKEIDLEEFIRLFRESKKTIVKFCATTLSLGGKYAEELLHRAEVSKDQENTSDEGLKKTYEALQKMFSENIDAKIAKEDATPFGLHTQKEQISKASFSESVEEVVVKEKIDAQTSQEESKVVSYKDKYDKIIKAQEANLKKYEKESVANKRKGEVIYEKYQEITTLFDALKELHAKGGWKEVKHFIKEHKYPITVNQKEGTITLEIKD